MVDVKAGELYDAVIKYLTETRAYLNDPALPEPNLDALRDLDLTELVYAVQRQVKAQPSLGEAATIKAYRDMISVGAETDIRLMKRSDYWVDAAEEGQDNIDKWTYNKTLINLHQNGKDSGA